MIKATQQPVSVWKILYGIFYGAIVAAAYFLLKYFSHGDGGLCLFAALSGLIFCIHFLIWPKPTLKGLLDRDACIRGVLYGLTQVMITKALKQGFTSTALVASTMGSVFGVLLGRLVLKEVIKGYALVGAAFCFIAVFLNPMLIFKSYWGVVGGLTQGLGFVLSRSLMLREKSIRQSISTGFLMSALVSLLAVALTEKNMNGFLSLKIMDVAILVAIAVMIQYGFFYLYKVLDSQRASLLTLSRLPWSMTFDYLILGSAFAFQKIIAACLIAAGSAFLLVDARVQKRGAEKL
jgi:drug/metabolite transporter (DMT)-like permease